MKKGIMQNCTLCVVDESLSSQEFGVVTTHSFRNTKSRVVLRGDIVKDDSGSYAVFIELWSSASQMTVAKVMDMRSRLPGCAGQAADAVSACTQVKMEDAPSLLKNSEVRMSRNLDTSTKTQMDQIMVQHGRSGRSFWTESVRSLFRRTLLKKANWQSSIGTRMGKYSNLGMLFRLSRNRTILVCVYGRYQVQWKQTKSWPNVEKTYEKTLIWENPHNSLTMCIWLALKENARWARIVWRTTQVCLNLGFLLVL